MPDELKVNVADNIKASDMAVADVGSPDAPVTGLIAILDALGAATYSKDEAKRFLESRDLVINKLNERADAGRIDKARLSGTSVRVHQNASINVGKICRARVL